MFLFVNLNVTLCPADMQFLRATLYLYMYAIVRIWYGNSVCLYVRPSVTRVDFIKTAEHII